MQVLGACCDLKVNCCSTVLEHDFQLVPLYWENVEPLEERGLLKKVCWMQHALCRGPSCCPGHAGHHVLPKGRATMGTGHWVDGGQKRGL